MSDPKPTPEDVERAMSVAEEWGVLDEADYMVLALEFAHVRAEERRKPLGPCSCTWDATCGRSHFKKRTSEPCVRCVALGYETLPFLCQGCEDHPPPRDA